VESETVGRNFSSNKKEIDSMSQLEECSFEEKEEESPMLDSNLKRKDVL